MFLTSQANTPGLALKNNSAVFEILVLPIRRFSISSVIRELDEFLVDPMSAVVASPNFSMHQSARNRSSRDDDGP